MHQARAISILGLSTRDCIFYSPRIQLRRGCSPAHFLCASKITLELQTAVTSQAAYQSQQLRVLKVVITPSLRRSTLKSISLFVIPPVQLILRLQAIHAAIVTDPIMAAQHCSTLHTPPLRVLTLYKSGKRMPLDKGEIFDDTHAVLLLISCVNSFSLAARDCCILVLFSLDHNVDIRRLWLYIRL